MTGNARIGAPPPPALIAVLALMTGFILLLILEGYLYAPRPLDTSPPAPPRGGRLARTAAALPSP